jgi:hypothetical protein
MSTMARNWWTTVLGFITGVVMYLNTSGVKLPSTKQEWGNFVLAALVAGLGYVAKDATTGSRP